MGGDWIQTSILPRGKYQGDTSNQITSQSLIHYSSYTPLHLWRRLEKNEIEWSWKAELKKAEFLLAGETHTAIFGPTLGLKEKNLRQFWILRQRGSWFPLPQYGPGGNADNRITCFADSFNICQMRRGIQQSICLCVARFACILQTE